MKNKQSLQLGSALLFVVIAVALLNPLHFWMPTMAHMLMLGIAIAVFGAFNVFVFAEQKGDEREQTNKMFAGRVAFFCGGVLLLLGIIVQSLADAIDPWLIGALVAMVLAKVGAGWYSDRYK